ncbi:MAG: beta-ketoacyl synthase N-terminal-like domain-containing protein, partial [Phycisphaerae bacterium]
TVGNYTAAALARGFDLTGPNLTLACGPASGLVAIAEGCRLIADGRADVVLAGGVEHLTDALAASLCPPGGWVSEGACLFVIERGEHAADRSVDLLASVTTLDDSDAYTAAPSDDNAADKVTNTTDAGGAGTSGSLVSTAAQARPGAIFIEQWIGHCFGAGGSAAVAAALAAMAGEEVPLVGGGAGDSIVPGRIDLEGHGGGKRMTAMIEAPTDSGGLSRLSVTTLGGG